MAFSVREIVEGDLPLIMRWRMDPDITKWMNTDPTLTLEGQREWLSRIRSDETVQYWMIEVDGSPAGVLNLADIDLKKGEARWGYYIGNSQLRSMQLAVSVELSLYNYCFEELGLRRVTNDPLAENVGVIKLHELCGCHVVEIRKKAVIKKGIAHDQVYMEIGIGDWNLVKSRKFDKIELRIQ